MRIGIDLGGTKIEIAVLDTDGRVVFRQRKPTPQGDYDATLMAVASLVNDAEEALNCQASVGIGIPGSISPDHGRVKNANSVCLIGKPMKHDLEQLLQREIRIANDADCFTLSEACDGAGADFKSVFGVILGTGVGGGFCWNRQLIQGPNAITGEWGHNPLPWATLADQPAPSCYCGKFGCIETWLSGPGFERQYLKLSGKELTAPDIVILANQGDVIAKRCLNHYIERLAKSLATIINVFDPYAIVLGGGMSNIDEIYPELKQSIAQFAFSDQVNTALLKAQHGDSSGVRGAAWLWPE
ncbi:MAG: ROK family protein [Hahellaceae bacterium]|nr:ROK family protein [Hahellaceae bacterium]